MYFTDFSIKTSFSLEYRDGFERLLGYNYARSLYLEGRAEDSLAQLQPIIDQVPAAKPAAVAALMKLGRENDVRRLLKGELDDEKIEELISAIKEKTK
ncbi:hypothetical protein [Sutterella wadsworthensis]